MVEVASGDILVGVHYVVSNTTDGTGTVTYNTIVYTHGNSFFGQAGVTTYSVSTANIKVYEDDTALDIISQITAEVEDEITPYPESLSILSQVTAENFNDNDEIVYPESILIQSQITAESTLNTRPQIIRTLKY